MFVAGGISGMTGFGVGTVGSIALAILVGPKAAVILLSILTSFASGAQVVKFRYELPVVRSLVWLATLATLNVYDWSIVAASLGLLVPTFCGQMTGFWLQGRIPKHIFERLVLALLAVAAGYLIYRGVLSAL